MRRTSSQGRASAFGQVSQSDLLEAELFFEELTGKTKSHTHPSARVREAENFGGPAFGESLRSANVSDENQRFKVNPLYSSDDGQAIPKVWEESDRVAGILARKQLLNDDVKTLRKALRRQVRTVETFRSVLDYIGDPATENSIDCYVLLFPGEARHNTGIKDLNDKSIGYQLNAEFIEERQAHIRDVFGGKFSVAGQDYKTAFILTKTGSRRKFDKRLRRLDRKLRDSLLAILDKAEERWKHKPERLQEIRRLRRKLRSKRYRFDIYYGLRDHPAIPRDLKKSKALSWCFILVTEALKAAAIGRYITKGRWRRFGKAAKRDRGFDKRGKVFKIGEYWKVVAQSGNIKEYVTKPFSKKHPYNFNTIWIETVWTLVFFKRRRVYYPNPDVIRAVRKRRLKRPRIRDKNFKFNFRAQRRILELWLVILNTLDFIKDFLRKEFSDPVIAQHNTAAKMLQDLSEQQPAVDWRTMTRILSTDVRLKTVAALGRASEYQFYNRVADEREWIIFSMDVRDLGVALMILYEDANEEIEDGKLKGEDLLAETFRSTDPINDRMRFTHDQVVDVFESRAHPMLMRQQRSAQKAAARAFGRGVRHRRRTPRNPSSAVRVMLGGDEIFVAAHPTYARLVPRIVKTLHYIRLKNGRGERLNMRTVVAFSRAKDARSSGQRDENKRAHQQSLDACDAAPKLLKNLEGQNRRIERLIAMLAGNPKKEHLVGKYRRRLKKLGLTRLYIQIGYRQHKVLSANEFQERMSRLRSGMLSFEDGETLVDFDGEPVDRAGLIKAANELEQAVRDDVGDDNTHVDPPPIAKIPKWLDDYLKDDDDDNR